MNEASRSGRLRLRGQVALIGRMDGRFDALAGRIDSNHAEMKGEIARLERKLDTLTLGVDSIDARLWKGADQAVNS